MMTTSRAVARLPLVALVSAAFVGSQASLVSGCSASSRGGAGPGTTTFQITSRAPAGCSLQRLALSIDGGSTFSAGPSDVSEIGQAPRDVARVRVRPGSHSLGVFASVACTSAELAGDPLVLTTRDGRSFLVGEGPATMRIELRVSDALPPPDGGRRLDVTMDLRGGELGPALGPDGRVELVGSVDGAGVDVRHCTALEVAPRAICRTEAIVAHAKAQKDVVRALCVRDKLAQIRTYATIIERAKQRAAGAPPADRAEDARIVADAEARVRALEGEVDRCVGEEIMKAGEGG